MISSSDGRVLHVINNLATGGAEMILHRLLSGMDQERLAPVVLSLAGRGTLGERIKVFGIQVHEAGMAIGLPKRRTLSRLTKIIRSLQPRIIQGWIYHGNLAATLARRPVQGTGVIWNVRHTPPHPI